MAVEERDVELALQDLAAAGFSVPSVLKTGGSLAIWVKALNRLDPADLRDAVARLVDEETVGGRITPAKLKAFSSGQRKAQVVAEPLNCDLGLCIHGAEHPPAQVGTGDCPAGRLTLWMPVLQSSSKRPTRSPTAPRYEAWTLRCPCRYGQQGVNCDFPHARAVLEQLVGDELALQAFWAWGSSRIWRAALFNRTIEAIDRLGLMDGGEWLQPETKIEPTHDFWRRCLGHAQPAAMPT